MVEELAKVLALQLGYHINGAHLEALGFKLFDGKPLCALNVPTLTPKVKPAVTTTKTSNVLVTNAFELVKRDDSKLFAFDLDDENDGPVSRLNKSHLLVRICNKRVVLMQIRNPLILILIYITTVFQLRCIYFTLPKSFRLL